MRKFLIAALVVVSILLAAAIGVVVYMEVFASDHLSIDTPTETTAPETEVDAVVETTAEDVSETSAEETEATLAVTEEIVPDSMPTEDSADIIPEDTFGQENVAVPGESGNEEIPATTENPDSNETPEDIF